LTNFELHDIINIVRERKVKKRYSSTFFL